MLRKGVLLLALVAIFIHFTAAQDNTIGVFYGRYTEADEEYKRIVDDAENYVTPSIRVTDFFSEINADGSKAFYTNVFQALRVGVCSRISSSNLKAAVVPNDICVPCQNIGGVVGNAINPVVNTDLTANTNAFRLYPDRVDLVELFTSLINYTKWRDFIILYDHIGAQRVAEALMSKSEVHNWTVTPYQVGDLKVLKRTLDSHRVKNILLFCEFEEIALDVVQMAIEEGLMRDEFHWMLGNINLPLVYSQIDKIRIGRAYVTRLALDFRGTTGRFTTQKAEPLDEWPFRLRATYDAILTINEAFKSYRSKNNQRNPTYITRCSPAENGDGSPLIEELKTVNFEGMTGPISFDSTGKRVNYTINVYMGKGLTVYFHSDLRKVPLGTWTQDVRAWEALNGKKWPGGNKRLHMNAFRNADIDSIKIASLQEAPYLIDSSSGFYGFIPEMLKLVKKEMEETLGLPFEYQLELVSDGDFGRLDAIENRWTGLMAKLVDGHSDIAAAPLAITPPRDEAIDFTVPFMKGELGVLIMHPNWVREKIFAALFPYSAAVWTFFVIAILSVGALLFALSYFNPYEWRSLALRGEATEEQGKYLNFWNSPWFQTTTIFFQGYDRSPRSWASRVLSGFWFYFSLMMIFIYLLNLTPFLTASKNIARVKDIGQLMQQTIVDVGFVLDSGAYDFFKNNELDQYRRMWEYIQSANSMYREDSTIVRKIEDGIHRVRHSNGQYVLIHDKLTLEAESKQRRCSLFITGGHFALVEYAFAVPSGSPLRDQLSYVIERLNERGELENLWGNATWFDPQKFGPCNASDSTKWRDQAIYSITTGDMMCMYLLLAMGMAGSIAIFIIEVVAFQLGFGSNDGTSRRSRPQGRLHGQEMRTEQYQPAAAGGGGAADQKMWI